MFNPQALEAQAIALAGLFQSLEQVQQCARNGVATDPTGVRVVLESVLRIDAPDASSVYGGLGGLRPGLTLLAQHLARKMSATQLEQARYAANLMALERRLSASPDAAAQPCSCCSPRMGLSQEKSRGVSHVLRVHSN